jgi:tetratricopeptide (TPR) repeat protein
MKKMPCKIIAVLILFALYLHTNAQSLQQGIQLSHSGNYNEAEEVFKKLLLKDANNISVLIAAGFNNAWNKNYTLAKKRFTKVKQLDPSNVDATKGLGYMYLYKGNFAKAASIFNNLSNTNPASEEYHISLGLAYLNMLKKNKAQKEFEKVLKINSTNGEADDFIGTIKNEKGKIEISALGGATGSGQTTKVGLRQIQVGYQFNSENIVYARYDNSLGLDNFFLLKNNFNTNAIVGGLYSRWHHRIGSKFEYSYRNLPENITQQILQTEQVIFLPKNFQIKLGGFFVNTQQPIQEWTLMGGLSVPVGKKLKVEPHYYYTDRGVKENRYLLNFSYKVQNDFDVAVGFMQGKEKIEKGNISRDILAIYGYSNFKISGPLSGTVLFRNEKDAFSNNVFTLALGAKLIIATTKNN